MITITFVNAIEFVNYYLALLTNVIDYEYDYSNELPTITTNTTIECDYTIYISSVRTCRELTLL